MLNWVFVPLNLERHFLFNIYCASYFQFLFSVFCFAVSFFLFVLILRFGSRPQRPSLLGSGSLGQQRYISNFVDPLVKIGDNSTAVAGLPFAFMDCSLGTRG